MGLAHDLGKTIGHALAPLRAGDDGLASRKVDALERRSLGVTSSAFTDGGSLPRRFTADGAGFSPPLAWRDVPTGTRSFVLVVEDPDAPMPKPFVHWLVYGIAPEATALDGSQHLEGKNTMLTSGYAPAAPPAGHGIHHYHFQVFALDTVLELQRGAGRNSLLKEMRGHVLGWGEIVGTYERS